MTANSTRSHDNNDGFDCLVMGAGPVGLTLALALRHVGLSTALCGTIPTAPDGATDLRTAALFAGSIRLLENLGVWPHLQPYATPVAAIRIIDMTRDILRAPTQTFSGADIGEEILGYNIPNTALIDALLARLDALAPSGNARPLDLLGANITHLDVSGSSIAALAATKSTPIKATLAVGADGRRSMARRAAGITTREWDRGQAAITAHFDHALPNGQISTEIHLPEGPCTIVPLGAHRSSLVWMVKTTEARRLADLRKQDFILELEKLFIGLIGPITNLTDRASFPLTSLIANRFAQHRVALVGESAHAFPPIGAQGLNLGLRDVGALADTLQQAKAAGHDIGSNAVLSQYHTDRWSDITVRTHAVDALNRSLSSPPLGLLRGAAMHAAGASSHLKRFLIERGMRPVGDWPPLMT